MNEKILLQLMEIQENFKITLNLWRKIYMKEMLSYSYLNYREAD